MGVVGASQALTIYFPVKYDTVQEIARCAILSCKTGGIKKLLS